MSETNRDEVKRFTQPEIISVLKKNSNEWLVTEINGHTWFSDGRVCIRCDGEELGDTTIFKKSELWKTAMAAILNGARDGYVRAEHGFMCGGFSFGYFGAFIPRVEQPVITYLNEMYVRAVLRASVQAEIWTHPQDPHKLAAFVLDGELIGVIMPMKTGTVIMDFTKMPEIPFLEDEVLYHVEEDDAE